MTTLRRHLRLGRRFLSQAIVRETNYRAHFFTTLIVGVIQTIISLIPIFVIYHYVPRVNGWSVGNTLALNGVFLLGTAYLSMFVQQNANRMNQYVGDGELDLILMRPVDTQFLTAFRWIDPAQIFNVVLGAIVLGIGLARSAEAVSAPSAVMSIVLFACALVVLTCLLMSTVYIAFWTTNAGALPMVIRDSVDMGRYPVSYYPGPLRIVLLSILPVGFATTVPTEALLGRASWWTVLAGIAFASLAVALSRRWWLFAVKRYASASS